VLCTTTFNVSWQVVVIGKFLSTDHAASSDAALPLLLLLLLL
jgi:hypothetical protein